MVSFVFKDDEFQMAMMELARLSPKSNIQILTMTASFILNNLVIQTPFFRSLSKDTDVGDERNIRTKQRAEKWRGFARSLCRQC